MQLRLIRYIATLALCCTLLRPSSAHTLQVEPIVAVIRAQDEFLTIEYTGNVQDIDQSISVRDDEKMRDGTYLPDAIRRTEQYFNERFRLTQDNHRYIGKVTSLKHESGLDPGVSKFHMFMRYERPAGLSQNAKLVVQSTLLDYLPNARIIVSLDGVSDTMSPGSVMEIDPKNLSVTLMRNIQKFTIMGIEHIFTGYDHMLFIVALILVSSNLGNLIKTLTGFTIAHSVTLCGAALGWFSFPPSITDILIPISIIYVGLENCFNPENRHRFLTACGFGLFHGFGFANNLRDAGLPTGMAQFWSLLSFNLGVEFAQVAICIISFPLLMRWKKDVEKRKGGGRLEWNQIVRYASAAVVAGGAYILWRILVP